MIPSSEECPCLSALPRPACLLDEKSVITCVNGAFQSFFAFTQAGVSIVEAVKWDDGSTLLEAIRGGNPTIVHGFTDLCGSHRSVTVHGTPTAEGMLCVFHDVESMRRLSESASLVLPAVDQIQEGILITDAGGRILYVNAAFELQSGWKAEQIVGQSPSILKSGTHSDSFYGEMWNRLLSGHAYRGEMQNRRKDGTIYNVEKVITPIFDENGRISHFVSTDRDVTEERLTQRRLMESETKFRTIFERSPLGIAVTDNPGHITDANSEFLRMLGMNIDELRGRHLKEITFADDVAENERILELVREEPVPGYELRKRYVRKDGSDFWARTVVAVVRDEMQRPFMKLGIIEDITERLQAEEALSRAYSELEDLRNALERVSLFAMMENDGTLLRVNDAFCEFFGREKSDLIGKPVYRLVTEKRSARIFLRALSEYRRKGIFREEIPLKSASGPQKWFDSTLMPLQDETGKGRGAAWIMFDVSDRKQAEEALVHQAMHDTLTDLPNRSLFSDRLHQALLRANRLNEKVAVLFVDIDRFKFVNDTFGHAHGDLILVAAARRIQSALRPDDTVSRQGGDEFMVLLPGLGKNDHAASVAEKVLASFEAPFAVNDTELTIGASIGIALYPDDASEPDDLLRLADMALYRAKEEGRGRYVFYNAAQLKQSRDRFEKEGQIRQAVREWQFVPYFQPRVHAHSGRMIAVEALIRWMHPVHGVLFPDAFIPIAEETGLIYGLGEGVFRDAVRSYSQWKHVFPEGFVFSVNLSAKQFYQVGLLEKLRDTVHQAGLQARSFELEITESTVMNLDQKTLTVLHDLRREGFRIALDDFGTGYSSLTYLERLPVDTIKIDRSFVTGLADSPRKRHLVQAMIMIAKALDLSVVAEGVERREELDLLLALGCEEVQGYLFGMPQPAEALFGALLE